MEEVMTFGQHEIVTDQQTLMGILEKYPIFIDLEEGFLIRREFELMFRSSKDGSQFANYSSEVLGVPAKLQKNFFPNTVDGVGSAGCSTANVALIELQAGRVCGGCRISGEWY